MGLLWMVTMKSNLMCLEIEQGDVIELCFERFGHIDSFVVEAVQHRGQPEEGYGKNNSFYVRVRKLEESDVDKIKLKKKMGKDRFYNIPKLRGTRQ